MFYSSSRDQRQLKPDIERKQKTEDLEEKGPEKFL